MSFSMTWFFNGVIVGSILCISFFYTNRKMLESKWWRDHSVDDVICFIFWPIFEGALQNQKLDHFWSSDQLQVFSDYINSNSGWFKIKLLFGIKIILTKLKVRGSSRAGAKFVIFFVFIWHWCCVTNCLENIIKNKYCTSLFRLVYVQKIPFSQQCAVHHHLNGSSHGQNGTSHGFTLWHLANCQEHCAWTPRASKRKVFLEIRFFSPKKAWFLSKIEAK